MKIHSVYLIEIFFFAPSNVTLWGSSACHGKEKGNQISLRERQSMRCWKRKIITNLDTGYLNAL
jgi:hypothetical protein